MSNTVYIIDASNEQRRHIADALAGTDAQVRLYESGEEFLQQLASGADGCVVAPSDLAGLGIRALIAAVRRRGPPLSVVVLGRGDDLPTVVELMRAGAAEYLESPLSARRLRMVVNRAIGSSPNG